MNKFFHIGSQKTGTTILARLIDQHPKIACMNEAYFLTPNHHASVFNPKIKTPRHGFRKTQRLKWHQHILKTGDYREPINEAMDNFGKRCRAEMVGDSWILYLKHIEKIVEMFPDAIYIYNVRDPRAVYNSGETFLKRKFGAKILNAMLTFDKIFEENKHRMSCNIVLKYEGLITNTEQTMSQIYSCLGFDYDPEYLEYDVKKDKYPKRWGVVAHPEIDAFHIDKWRENLTVAKVEEIETIAGDFMDKYGYERLVVK